jgi:hypothetical protein
MILFNGYIRIVTVCVLIYVLSYTVTDVSEEPVPFVFRSETPARLHGIRNHRFVTAVITSNVI